MNNVKITRFPKLPYAVEESLNRLRVNVSFFGKKYKKIMVISSMPNEGKSFIAMNLWMMFSQSGKKSLLIDSDLRKSVLIDDYGIEGEKTLVGLSDYLSGYTEVDDIVCSTDIEGGYLIPNVKNILNPSFLFEGNDFQELISRLEPVFDYLIIDAPPLNLVSDGERIGSMCDGAILVVRAGETPRDLVKNSMRQLERAGCPVLGIVLNRAMTKGSGYYSKKYYSNKYYGQYSKNYYGDSKK